MLAVAAKAGIDLRTMVEVIRTGGAGNFFIDRMVEGINERGRPTHVRARRWRRRTRDCSATWRASTACRYRSSAQVAQALVAALGAGLGDRDFTDIVALIERQAGVKLRLGPPRA